MCRTRVWLAGYNKNSKGEERLAKTLRRRGYCGADFTAPTDGPGVVQHIDLCFARKQKKSYAIADAEALMDFLQELDQEDIDANQPMLNDVLQRMGARPGRLITRYPRVALIENGENLAVVKRQGCKPRLALFALLKTFAPCYNPWYLFYRMGLKEFLSACGVHEPSPKSGSTGGCPLVLPEFEAIDPELEAADHERGAADPASAGSARRRIIFDLENISEHKKAAGAKSEGLSFGPCCDYNGSKPVLLCDLEIVFLVLMRLRTSEVRELQAVVSHQGLVNMGGNAAVATAMANHWKAECEAKPCNLLLQFLGAAVEHEAAQASGVDTVDKLPSRTRQATHPSEAASKYLHGLARQPPPLRQLANYLHGLTRRRTKPFPLRQPAREQLAAEANRSQEVCFCWMRRMRHTVKPSCTKRLALTTLSNKFVDYDTAPRSES